MRTKVLAIIGRRALKAMFRRRLLSDLPIRIEALGGMIGRAIVQR
jgi:hypothetical protein